MIHTQNIMVPVDFSEPSQKALTYGLSLAEQFKAELILAHIVPESSARDGTSQPQLHDLSFFAFNQFHGVPSRENAHPNTNQSVACVF